MLRSFLTRLVDSVTRTVLLAFGVALAGCYTPAGRPFEPAPAPGAEGALVYVYHVSPSRSVRDYGERILVDGSELGLLQTNFGDICEYLWLHIAPGPHRLEVETNSRWFASAPKNPVTLDLNATAGSVYVVRVETARNVGMWAGVSASTSGGVQSGSGFYAGAGAKTIDYTDGLDNTELRDCRIVGAPAVR